MVICCLVALDAGKRVNVLAQGQIQPLGVAITREGNIAVTDCQGKRVKVRWSDTLVASVILCVRFCFLIGYSGSNYEQFIILQIIRPKT